MSPRLVSRGMDCIVLQPKKTKFRKKSKGRNRGLASRGSSVSFGEYGMRAVGRARITAREIEAARRAVTRYVKRGGKIWIRVFPDHPVSRKALGVRMGGGKGSVEYWTALIRPGRILYEIGGVAEDVAREAFRRGGAKLSVKTAFASRDLMG